MFRLNALRHSIRVPSLSTIRQSPLVLLRTQPIAFPRYYSSAPELTKENITERILEILEDYDNVKNVEKISPKANFNKDLGLDSLDQVEVLMEVENEFSIIIPDDDADQLKSVEQTVEYILKQPDAC